MKLVGQLVLVMDDAYDIKLPASCLTLRQGYPMGTRYSYDYRDPEGRFILQVSFTYEEGIIQDDSMWFPEEHVEIAYDYGRSWLLPAIRCIEAVV